MSFTRLLVAAAGALSLTACGSEPPPTTSDQEPLVIQVALDGNSVTPNGNRVEVAVGQPIALEVTADRAGEIHVHSDPEQELEYAAGNSTITMMPISRPGVVDVESHTLKATIVQLEAR